MQASSPTLATSPQGELTLKGLPNGPFRWSVVLSGERFEGTVVVPPHDERAVTIDL